MLCFKRVTGLPEGSCQRREALLAFLGDRCCSLRGAHAVPSMCVQDAGHCFRCACVPGEGRVLWVRVRGGFFDAVLQPSQLLLLGLCVREWAWKHVTSWVC